MAYRSTTYTSAESRRHDMGGTHQPRLLSVVFSDPHSLVCVCLLLAYPCLFPVLKVVGTLWESAGEIGLGKSCR